MKKYLLLLGFLFLAQPVKAETLSQYFGRLPSVKERIPMAIECGVNDYKATAKQNEDLLVCLKKLDAVLGVPQVVPTKAKEGLLGASYTPVTGYQSRTTQYISSSVTTIPVASTKDKAGNQISLSDISSSGTVKVYMNLEPGTSKEEPIICTGVTATTWTGCTRGVSFQGSSETTSSTIATTHNAGAAIIITNIGQFFNQYVSIDGTQNVNGVKTFINLPKGASVTTIPTTADQLATKYYVDNVGAGGFTANNVGKGLQALGTVPEKVAFNPAATSTSALGFSGSSVYVVTSTNGGIINYSDGLALATTTARTWSGAQTFTGGVNVSSTNATPNFLADGFAMTSSTVTSTISGGLAVNRISPNPYSTTATTTIVGNLQVNGAIDYTGKKFGATQTCAGSSSFNSTTSNVVSCGFQPSIVLITVTQQAIASPYITNSSGTTDCSSQYWNGTDSSGNVSGGSGNVYSLYTSGGNGNIGTVSCSASGFTISNTNTGSQTMRYSYTAFR